MRTIKEILRLKIDLGLSNRRIASSLKISRSTVGEYLDRFYESGLSREKVFSMGTEELKEKLLVIPVGKVRKSKYPPPDWEEVFREVKKKGVTLHLLWEEYREENNPGYGYSQYCDLFGQWKKKLDLCMRQNHKAGEKLFVDYAGMKFPVTNPITGEIKEANIFVATFGASNYTYTEAHYEQNKKNWINAHINAFKYFGGTPEILVPDNLKAGVKSPCYYEPDINPTYQKMAEHYNLAVIPARVRKPKDKAKVEIGVQVIEQSALAPLRKRTFFSVQDLNKALMGKLEEINKRVMKHIGKSRKELFHCIDKPSLRLLPIYHFEYSEWKSAKVGFDYHLKYDNNYYSAPYQYFGKNVEIKASRNMIEVFYKNQSIALHKRLGGKNLCSTNKKHMPVNHRRMVEWTPQRFVKWAEKTGEHTASLIKKVLDSRDHPQQSFRKCMGILKLGKRYSEQRLENACLRALEFNILSYKVIKSILEKGLDHPDLEPTESNRQLLLHKNIRGRKYYQEIFNA